MNSHDNRFLLANLVEAIVLLEETDANLFRQEIDSLKDKINQIGTV